LSSPPSQSGTGGITNKTCDIRSGTIEGLKISGKPNQWSDWYEFEIYNPETTSYLINYTLTGNYSCEFQNTAAIILSNTRLNNYVRCQLQNETFTTQILAKEENAYCSAYIDLQAGGSWSFSLSSFLSDAAHGGTIKLGSLEIKKIWTILAVLAFFVLIACICIFVGLRG
jgi:hypothetical protein